MLICVIPGDIYLDHLVKMVSSGFPHRKVTLSFRSLSVSWRTCLRLCKTFPHQNFLLIFPNFSIYLVIFSATIIAILTDLWISFISLIPPHTYSLEFYWKEDLWCLLHFFINLIICFSKFPRAFILFYELHSNVLIIYSIEKLFQLWPLGFRLVLFPLPFFPVPSFLPSFFNLLTLWDQKFQTTHSGIKHSFKEL